MREVAAAGWWQGEPENLLDLSKDAVTAGSTLPTEPLEQTQVLPVMNEAVLRPVRRHFARSPLRSMQALLILSLPAGERRAPLA